MFQIIISISAVPRPKTLVNAAIGVFSGFGASKLLLHPAHPGAKRLLTGAAFGLGALQAGLPGVGSIVGSTSLGV